MRRKFISLFLVVSFLFQQTGLSYALSGVDISGYLSGLSGVATQDKFRPLHMRYFSYNPQNNDFDLLLDKGDEKGLKGDELKEKTAKLLEYFKIGLTLPNDKFWVNLRPDAQDEIIDPDLEKTDIGKVLLEADLQLKKDTAGATSPQTPEGKKYWDKLYKKAGELFGTENITIPTVTRPWIVPGEVIINTSASAAYIYKANLKVMLEEDYLSRGGFEPAPTYQQYAFSDPRLKELNQYSTQLIRELIIPRLTKEINTAKRYSALRQVFYSLVLAKWFKARYRAQRTENRLQNTEQDNNYFNLIDSGNLADLTSVQPWDKQVYFRQYRESFQDGEYNLKETVYSPSSQALRAYVSGGTLPMSGEQVEIPVKNMKVFNHPDMVRTSASAMMSAEFHKTLKKLQAESLSSRGKKLAFVKSREEAEKIDPELAKVVFEKGNNRIEWAAMVDWILNTDEGQAALENTLKLGREIRKKYKYVIACGIGGSGEGVEVIRRNFGQGAKPRLYPLMTPDADAVNGLIKSIADSEGITIEDVLKDSAVFFITKSGSTPETTSHFNYFKELYERTALSLKEHIWIMTDPNSKMAGQEYKEKYNLMTIQLNAGTGIGGRFTSPSTNIPLFFLSIFNDGIVKEMLEEAERLNNVPAEEDMFLKLAAFIGHYTKQVRNNNITLFIPEEFKVWFLQLFEESLGKELKGVTFFPAGDKLTPENLRPDDIFVRITIGGEKTRQDLWEHLQSKNYPAFELDIKDKKGIFGLQMGLARAVIALAYLWKICAVDQDAVEGYKKGGNLIRDELKKSRSVEDILKEKNWASIKTGSINLYYGQLLKAGLITKTEIYNKLGMLPEGVFRNASASAWYAAVLKALEEKGHLNSAEIAYYCQPNDQVKEMVEAGKEDMFTKILKIRARVSQGTARNHATHQNAKAGQETALTVMLPLKFIPAQNPGLPYYSPDLMPALAIATVADLSEDAKRPSMLITTDIGINEAKTELEDFFSQVNYCLSQMVEASSAVEMVYLAGIAKEKGFLSESALKNILSWQGKEYRSVHQELAKEFEAAGNDPAKWKEINDAWYRQAAIGTAGMRGKMGLGTNRINKFTFGRLAAAQARVVKGKAYTQMLVEKGVFDPQTTKPAVAIGGDTRKRSYDPNTGGPGEFIKFDALINVVMGVKAYVFRRPTTTPQLSWTVANLEVDEGYQIISGSMNTASHNPKTDNGKKPYKYDGSQITGDFVEFLNQELETQTIAELVELKYKGINILADTDKAFELAVKNGNIKYLGRPVDSDHFEDDAYGVDEKFIERELRQGIYASGIDGHFDPLKIELENAKIVLSCLGGGARPILEELLKRRGVKEKQMFWVQSDFDPEFSQVEGGKPNPELESARSTAIKKAVEIDADIVFWLDPDADRPAVAVRKYPYQKAQGADDYLSLNGNQQLAVVADYIIGELRTLAENAKKRGVPIDKGVYSDLRENAEVLADNWGKLSMATTVVSGDLMKVIARANGIKTIETLTGFKYIGDEIEKRSEYARKQANIPYQDWQKLSYSEKLGYILRYNSEVILMGGEESLGLTTGLDMHDKDALSGILWLLEIFGRLRILGSHTVARLNGIYDDYGYLKEAFPMLQKGNIYSGVTFSEEEAMGIIKGGGESILNYFRNTPLKNIEIAGKKVIAVLDFQNQTAYNRDGRLIFDSTKKGLVTVGYRADDAGGYIDPLMADFGKIPLPKEISHLPNKADLQGIYSFGHIPLKRDNKQDNLPPENFIMLILEDGSKIIPRPSGTESIVKFYINGRGLYEKRKELDSWISQAYSELDKITDGIARRRFPEKFASSAMEAGFSSQQKDFKGGGIDMKGDSWIQAAGMNNIREFSDVLPRNINRELDIDKELKEIKSLIQGGNVPSPQRLGEDIAYCLYKDRFGAHKEDIELSLMGVGRLKEDYGLDMGKEYLRILFLVQSISNPFESENYMDED